MNRSIRVRNATQDDSSAGASPKRILRQSASLEFVEERAAFEQVGGLDALKAWRACKTRGGSVCKPAAVHGRARRGRP